MSVPSRKYFEENKEGVKLPPGWHTLKIIDVKRWDPKNDPTGKKLPAIIISVANEEDLGIDIWLKQEPSPSGMNERVWNDIANVFNLDWDSDVDFDELVSYFNQQLVGENIDILIAHAQGKGDRSGEIYVNAKDFAPAGEGQDTEKAPPAKAEVKTPAKAMAPAKAEPKPADPPKKKTVFR